MSARGWAEVFLGLVDRSGGFTQREAIELGSLGVSLAALDQNVRGLPLSRLLTECMDRIDRLEGIAEEAGAVLADEGARLRGELTIVERLDRVEQVAFRLEAIEKGTPVEHESQSAEVFVEHAASPEELREIRKLRRHVAALENVRDEALNLLRRLGPDPDLREGHQRLRLHDAIRASERIQDAPK